MLSALYNVMVAIVQAIKNRDKFAFEVFVMVTSLPWSGVFQDDPHHRTKMQNDCHV